MSNFIWYLIGWGVGAISGWWITYGVFKKQARKTEKKSDDVYCVTCGVKVREYMAKKVEAEDIHQFTSNGFYDSYYCQAHAPKYDKIGLVVGWGAAYYKKMLVDINGEPIGYKKK